MNERTILFVVAFILVGIFIIRNHFQKKYNAEYDKRSLEMDEQLKSIDAEIEQLRNTLASTEHKDEVDETQERK